MRMDFQPYLGFKGIINQAFLEFEPNIQLHITGSGLKCKIRSLQASSREKVPVCLWRMAKLANSNLILAQDRLAWKLRNPLEQFQNEYSHIHSCTKHLSHVQDLELV